MPHIVLPYPATNSSVRVRALRWLDRAVLAGRIERSSVTCHGPGFPGRSIARGEHVLLLRNARKLTRGATEARLLRRADLGVYDLDDGLPWDDGNLPGLGHWTKRPFSRARVAARAAEAADRIIVGNEVLADWATDRCRDVRLIPTCVDPSDYDVRTAWELSQPPVIGWIGSPATEHYLVEISAALAEAHRVTGARVHIISGAGSLHPSLAGFATRSLWSEGAERSIAHWDVGVMPLSDGVYERAKCGYKLLQYAASGVPAVASPVGVNERLIAAMDGLGPSSVDEWADALITLLSESAERRRSRALAGLRAVADYSYDVWDEAWLDAVDW